MVLASSFWSMGGYASFVWPSYFVVAFVLLGLLIWTLSQSKSLKKRLALLEQLKEKKN
ncbi:heme exporter protein CcmD [Alphaproteobacteria bacterium]|jgi:heme exporter protein D|nr:heme exporter protein CcmD [Alphaproteobacteria bacterium]